MTRSPGSSRRSSGRGIPPRREIGFATVAALIVLVLLGSIGSAMLRLSSAQQASSSAAVLAARAGWAAQTGIEWAIAEADAAGSCPSGTLTLTESALSGFSVDVSCAESRHWEGSEVIRNLRVTSQARFGTMGTADYVFREIEAMITL